MPAAIQDRPTAQAGKTPLVVRLLVLATFVVILNETLMINAINGWNRIAVGFDLFYDARPAHTQQAA